MSRRGSCVVPGVTLFSLCDSSSLNWTGISELLMSKMNQYHFPWRNYLITKQVSQTSRSETGFIMFTRFVSSESGLKKDCDSGYKIHIALNFDDIQTAFNPILQLLDRQLISTFKIIASTHYDQLMAQGQFGKVFTIYLPSHTPESVETLSRQIDRVLLDAKVLTPTKSATQCAVRKDSPIPSSPFVTYAQPREKLAGLSEMYSGTPSFNGSGDEDALRQDSSYSNPDNNNEEESQTVSDFTWERK